MTRTATQQIDPEAGKRLKEVRAKIGLTAADLARHLEVSRGYWSELENGKAAPSEKLLARMNRAFGVNLAYLSTGVVPMFDTADGLPLDPEKAAQEQVRPAVQRFDLPKKVNKLTSTGGVDAPLLSAVLAAVHAALDQLGLRLPPEKLAELVALIYEYEESLRRVKGPSQDSDIEGTARRFLRLVA